MSVWDARRNPYAEPNLVSLRNSQEHKIKRKAWNRAFTTSTVQEYEPVVAKRVLQLANKLESECNSSGAGRTFDVDMSVWFGYYS